MQCEWPPRYELTVACTFRSHWDHSISVPSLLARSPAPPPTSLSFVRTGLHGRVTGYAEVSFVTSLNPVSQKLYMRIDAQPTCPYWPHIYIHRSGTGAEQEFRQRKIWIRSFLARRSRESRPSAEGR